MTNQQTLFIAAVVAGEKPLAAYRRVYPAKKAARKSHTERVEAYRMVRQPHIRAAIEEGIAMRAVKDPEVRKAEAVYILAQIARGRADPRRYRAARQVLREAERDLERLRKEAERRSWQAYYGAVAAYGRGEEIESEQRRRTGGAAQAGEGRQRFSRPTAIETPALSGLTHASFSQRASPGLTQEPPCENASQGLSELSEYVARQQRERATEASQGARVKLKKSSRRIPNVDFNRVIPAVSAGLRNADESGSSPVDVNRPVKSQGSWKLEPIKGRFPVQYRRVWIPAD
jgi:hypothetical protein